MCQSLTRMSMVLQVADLSPVRQGAFAEPVFELHDFLAGVETHLSNSVVMKQKLNVPRPKPVSLDKFFIPRRTLILGVAGQHALYAHADALCALYRTPPLAIKQVETYNAV